jgi:hypothetical protein
MDHSSDC